MKQVTVILAVLMALTAVAQEPKNFSIKGTISQTVFPVVKVFLSYKDGEKEITDSAVVNNGSYVFAGKITEPVLARLRARYQPAADGKPLRTVPARDFATIFLSPVTTYIASVDSFANAKVQGSVVNDAFVELNAMLKPPSDVSAVFGAEYNKANAARDEASKKAVGKKLDSMDVLINEVYGTYLKKFPKSPIAFFAASQYAGWNIDVDKIEAILKQLPEEQKQYNSTKKLFGIVETAKKTAIGKTALDFTQNDTLGLPVTLSSFRGKYVLVDFWASWCNPCRAEYPAVVKIYQAYKDKNFHILGVSLDRPGAKDRWLEAIHTDNLNWTHVSDLKWWQNEVAQLYGIQAVPQNLLIDPSGKIIAKNLDGAKLEKKLAEIYGK